MIKKILLWTIYAAFIGLLIFGAIYRSNEKLGDTSGHEVSQSQNSGGNGESRSQSGGGQGNSASHDTLTPTVSTEDTLSTENDSPLASLENNERTYDGLESEHDWLTLEGTVTFVSTRELTVTLNDGQTLTIGRRAWRFAQENGFVTLTGNRIQLIGFYEEDEFQAAQLYDLTIELQVQIRDETGHPLWASG